MTEFSIVFVSRPEDTLEQTINTVGFVSDHMEVSDESTQHIYYDFTIVQNVPWKVDGIQAVKKFSVLTERGSSVTGKKKNIF